METSSHAEAVPELVIQVARFFELLNSLEVLLLFVDVHVKISALNETEFMSEED